MDWGNVGIGFPLKADENWACQMREKSPCFLSKRGNSLIDKVPVRGGSVPSKRERKGLKRTLKATISRKLSNVDLGSVFRPRVGMTGGSRLRLRCKKIPRMYAIV